MWIYGGLCGIRVFPDVVICSRKDLEDSLEGWVGMGHREMGLEIETTGGREEKQDKIGVKKNTLVP
jgi:hypothetical protein